MRQLPTYGEICPDTNLQRLHVWAGTDASSGNKLTRFALVKLPRITGFLTGVPRIYVIWIAARHDRDQFEVCDRSVLRDMMKFR
ncbi:hypothetical protein ACQ4M3_16250 [Leptolyngbya sp. AN03gr2]|uniref:hypothetical protein n=1 Tax=unclassified Leptolyngbya TaxID=2650499 RepID=UPI003D31690E